MKVAEIEPIIMEAQRAVEAAQKVRAQQRRRRRPDRFDAIEASIDKINESMRQVRPLVHAATFRAIPRETELRLASAALQAERRKLKKMRRV